MELVVLLATLPIASHDVRPGTAPLSLLYKVRQRLVHECRKAQTLS